MKLRASLKIFSLLVRLLKDVEGMTRGEFWHKVSTHPKKIDKCLAKTIRMRAYFKMQI